MQHSRTVTRLWRRPCRDSVRFVVLRGEGAGSAATTVCATLESCAARGSAQPETNHPTTLGDSLEHTLRYKRIAFSMWSLALASCADLTSVPKPIGIEVSTPELNLTIGEEKVLGAWLIDDKRQPVSGSPDWSSSDPTIATIDRQQGVVSAIAVGTATMTASFGVWHATALVRVRPKALAVALSMSTSAMTLIVGLEDVLVAHLTDATGRAVAETITWTSSNPAVATVEHGRVSGKASGETTVTATAGPLTATATVSTIALPGSISYARWTPFGLGTFTTDVLSFSPADGQTRSLERFPPFESIATPAWSRDGSLLAVEVIHEFTYYAGEQWTDYSSDLYVVDPAAPPRTAWRALTSNGFSKAPSWSPDGTRIAYVGKRDLISRSNIFIVGVDGSAPGRVPKTDGNYLTPRWSPDGTRLAFTAYEPTLRNIEVFVVNADGSDLRNVSNDAGDDYDPSWSPDGTHLAFVSTRWISGSVRYDIFVMQANGNFPRRLTTQPEYSSSPAWSPDGARIVFAAGPALFVINADGSAMARLTTPPPGSTDTNPSWRR
jgi:Tol biopolymer transport system component